MDIALDSKLLRFWALLGVCLSISGCIAQNTIGARPTSHLMTAVEAYLQQYQPGPKPRLFQTTVIYDRNGELITEIYPEGRRTWVSLGGVSQHLIDATVATEDASFYRNPGIDMERFAGAAIQNIRNRDVVSGASTITMQLARNLFMGWERRYDQSLDRKIEEIGIARELTELFTKDEILEIYLNLLNYGNLNYGPEAAARFYYGKSAADLNLAEATLLAGIPQNPAGLDPIRNIYAVKQRQKVVLDLMVRHNYLIERQATAAYKQPLLLRHSLADSSTFQHVDKAPHFSQYVLSVLGRKLGSDYVSRSGLRIVTTLDLTMQESAQRIVSERVSELAPKYDLHNAALVAMKPGTAEVLVMVGSADFDDDAIAGQVNVATSLRQPGSTIKPLIYASAIDRGLLTPDTILMDEPVAYQLANGDTYSPHNADHQYHGAITVRTALANSYNVPAVKVLDAIGIQQTLPKLREMGLHSLNGDDCRYGLSLALGSAEVTLLELSAGYHTLANQGIYREPQVVLVIVDPFGRSDIQQEAPPAEQVISPQTALAIADVLSDAEARAPAYGYHSSLALSRPAAVKTGTTTNWRDSLTVGYTRYLVVGVWAGNTDGRPTRGSTGIASAGVIWNAFMEAVLSDPLMLTKLDAPSDEAQWQFEAPQMTY